MREYRTKRPRFSPCTSEATDGLSNTAMMSESLLGDGGENVTGAIPGDPRLVYAYVAIGTALNDANCAAATTWNNANRRGFMWASGEV